MNVRTLAFILFYFINLHNRGLTKDVKRIINGENTDVKRAPYMLSFMLRGKHACGAAIINNYFAITAAHCIKTYMQMWYRSLKHPLEDITVRSGSSKLDEGGTIHRVMEFFIHEKYDEETNDYDIAVIKVTPPFIYDTNTNAVELASDNVEQVYKEWGECCGWGYYRKNRWGHINPILSENLKCTYLRLVEKSSCYEDYRNKYEITPQMTCYGFQNGVTDACQGDSGGPIVNKNSILLAITSWGEGCAKAYSPGVYTDAIVLRHWIKSKIKS